MRTTGVLLLTVAAGQSKLAKWIGNGFPPHHVAGMPTKFDLSGSKVMFAALDVLRASHRK
jgi:hypothetical protein